MKFFIFYTTESTKNDKHFYRTCARYQNECTTIITEYLNRHTMRRKVLQQKLLYEIKQNVQ